MPLGSCEIDNEGAAEGVACCELPLHVCLPLSVSCAAMRCSTRVLAYAAASGERPQSSLRRCVLTSELRQAEGDAKLLHELGCPPASARLCGGVFRG